MEISRLLNPLPLDPPQTSPQTIHQQPPPPPPPPPQTPQTPPQKRPNCWRLTRDERVQILCLRQAKWTYRRIADFIGPHCSEGAVQYCVKQGRATPQHSKSGRHPRLQKDEVDRIIAYMKQSRTTRQMTARQLVDHFYPEGDVSPESLRLAFKRYGVRR